MRTYASSILKHRCLVFSLYHVKRSNIETINVVKKKVCSNARIPVFLLFFKMSLNRVNLVDYNSPSSSSSSTQRVLHCTICNIYPRGLQAYVEHLDIRHRDEEVEVACPVDGCEETFPSVARFKIHIRKIHSTPTNNKSSVSTSGLLSSSNATTIRTNNDIDEASSEDDEDSHRRNSYLKRPKLEGKKRFGTVSRMTKIEPSDSMEYGMKSEDEFADVRFSSFLVN